MAGKAKWVVVGGAAAFAITPVAVYASSTFADSRLGGTGIVVSATMRTLDQHHQARQADRAAKADMDKAPSTTSPNSPSDPDDSDDSTAAKKNGDGKSSAQAGQKANQRTGAQSADSPLRMEVVTPVSPKTARDDDAEYDDAEYDDADDAPAPVAPAAPRSVGSGNSAGSADSAD